MNLSENLIWKYLIAAVHKTRHNFFSSCKEWQQSSLSDGKKKDSHSKTISFFSTFFQILPQIWIFFSLSSKMLSYNFARLTLNLKGLFKLKILTTIWQKLTYLLRLIFFYFNDVNETKKCLCKLQFRFSKKVTQIWWNHPHRFTQINWESFIKFFCLLKNFNERKQFSVGELSLLGRK